MRTWSIMTVAAVALVVVHAQDTQKSPQMFRSAVRTVPLYATVVDKSGRLIEDLEEKDFQIFDNGKPQKTTQFIKDVQPFSVIIALDTSGSMTLNLKLLKQAAEAFVIRLMPQDKARILNFDDRVTKSPRFSSNRDDLIRYIYEDVNWGNGTVLWDAVDASMASLDDVQGRRVVLLFTDGQDDGSTQANLDEVMSRARQSEIMIYSIGLHSRVGDMVTKPDKGIRTLAAETGGGYFELSNAADLNSTFTRVADELHRQYVLGFTPQILDNKLHKLELKVLKPDMTARARQSYFARPDQ